MKLREFFELIYGDQEGYVVLCFKDRTIKGKKSWSENPYKFRWPRDATQIAKRVIQRRDAGYDVYYCPVLFPQPKRERGTSLPTRVLSFELDAEPTDQELFDQLGAMTVASGTPGHQHVYVFLTEPVDAATADRLTENIAKALGVHGSTGGKWEDNALLRVPGTLNFKGVER